MTRQAQAVCATRISAIPVRSSGPTRQRTWLWPTDQEVARRRERFYSTLAPPESPPADQRGRASRRVCGPPPSAMRPWVPGFGVRAVHEPRRNPPRTGTDRPTDGHGPAHGRGRRRPRTGPAGAVMQTALTRIPALTCHFRMPAPCRRRPRHRGLARCPGCRGPRRCAGWLRRPGRRCSGRRS